ncbi:hypothetical protein DYB37_004537 [Aphanomyces astaci]|uniref:Uncharacterized protein n=1 Tax=Aphanomyces astaci TaxID=112090 RepID=A0A3R6Z2M9_APHAT|nr:hypothetical protein DYB35_004814 [Aphanomyces astaci]RHZ31676.1 hypothetical protein DYB37_004537 [Aphanomyces astaci]
MALAAESTLGSALEAVDVTLKDDDVLYAKHILDAERHRERAQAMARAEHQARSVENAYKRSVHDAMVQYERECAQLKKTMVDDILAELKLLRDNRDGVSLVRKGLARSARSSRANVTYTEEPDIDGVQTLAIIRTINLSVTSPSPSDNDDDMDSRGAAAVDSADVVMAAPATPPPATSSFSCTTLFSSNFVQRVLSASVLAPSVIYFIYTGSNTAVLTLGAAVVSICLFEFSWLSLRIQHRGLSNYLAHLDAHPLDDPMSFATAAQNTAFARPFNESYCAVSAVTRCVFSYTSSNATTKVAWREWIVAGTLSILFAASATGVVYALMLAQSVHEPIFLVHVGASALIAGVCAGLTPTSFDAAVLLVQVVAFSMAHAHVVSAAATICLDLVGLLYIPITFRMLMSELGYTPSGQEIAIRYLFIVWGCDTGAYVTGKLLTKCKYKFSRRSKLAPLISPNKDVEGTVGGVALAVVASCVANAGFVVDTTGSAYGEYIHSQLDSAMAHWQLAVFALVGACMLDRVDGHIFMSAILVIFHRAMFPSLYECDNKYKIANDMVFLSNKDQL